MNRGVAAFAAFAALALCTVPAHAQTVIRGTVVSVRDGAPVVAAEVASRDGTVRARTDELGRFHIALSRGDSLTVRALGYNERRLVLDADSTAVRLEPHAMLLPAVTTTAGQRTMSVNESTASVAVVSRADLDAVAATGVNQLLRQLSGLQELPSLPSKSTIAIRGLDGPRVLVLVDGEPVAGALIDTRDIGRLSTVAAERIEVTKGPSSVEFGSDALGGVINVVTAAPSKAFSTAGTVRMGGLGRREATGDLSDTKGAFGYRLSGGWRQVDRIVAVSEAGTSLDRVYDVRADARYRANDALRLRADVQLSQERQRWPVGGGYNGFIDNHGAQALGEAQLLAHDGIVRLRMFAQWSDYQYRQSQQLVPIAGSADSLEQQEQLARALLAYSRVAGGHTLDAGAQISARSIVAPQKIEGDRAHDRVAEFFARDAWTRGRLLATLGARATWSSLWGSAATPSAGVAWQLGGTWRARAHVARGFRAPSFKEIRYTFTNPVASYVIEGNAGLEPESSWNTDVALAWAPRGNLTLDVAGYRTRVSNLIDTRLTGLNAAGFQVYRNLNVARARIDGAEVTARAAFPRGDASVAYAYVRARDAATGRGLERRAAHTARAQVSRRWGALSDVTTDFSVHYTGAAPVGEHTQGALLSVDGQLRLAISQRFELSAGVNNLFDARPALWTPASQRQVFAGISVRAAR